MFTSIRSSHIVAAALLMLMLGGCRMYGLTVNITGEGTVSINPTGGSYLSGKTVTLTPAPETGWHFDHWEGDLTGSASPAQITMTAAKNVTAVFVVDQLALTVQASGGGTVTLDPPGGSYDPGTVVTLTPVPSTDRHFDHWEGDLSGSANPAQITMNAAKTVTAVFAVGPYALSTQVSGGGTVALNPPGGSYEPNTVVYVSASPSTGWHFDHWEGDLSGGATATQITMDASKSVTAVFAREQYTLTVSVTGGGGVTLNPPGGVYDYETVVTLTPSPAADKRFEIWGGALAGTATPAQITMTGNKYVEAFFMDNTLTTFSPSNLCAVGPTVYFFGNGTYSGRELWKSDGTFAGTKLVKDLAPGSGSPSICYLANFKGTLHLLTSAGDHYGLWKSDGTEAGTVEVAQLGQSFPAMPPLVMGEKMYFSCSGTVNGELWVTDGTAAGTTVVKSFGPGTGMPYSPPSHLTDVGGVLYFSTNVADAADTLWKSDGTGQGTVSIYTNADVNEIADLNGTALFGAADTPGSFRALIATDGTDNGTTIQTFDFGPANLVASNGLLFFTAQLNFGNSQVWASNGTSASKIGGGGYRAWGLTNLNTKLLYIALYTDVSVERTGLFATTGSGATLLATINPTLFYSYSDCSVVVGTTMFFTAENSIGGVGLWKSDGTGAGTAMVSEIYTTPPGVDPTDLTAVGTKLFFSAADNPSYGRGHQLWISDGTNAGTYPVSCPLP